MLISKLTADPHANGMVTFFSDLLYIRAEKKKTPSLIIASILNEQGFLAYRQKEGPVPYRPCWPPAAIRPSVYLR